jgi:hypothetical protein
MRRITTMKTMEDKDMGREINLLETHPRTVRDYDKRAAEKTPEIVRLAKQFGRDFFDGDRRCGYGGFRYDGRWKSVVRRMRQFYGLKEDAAILDVGCAKGFMLHVDDWKKLFAEVGYGGDYGWFIAD